MRDELTSREKRRRRRIRNQILAYITLVVLAVVALAGGYYSYKGIVRYVKNYNEKVSDAIAEAESSIADELESEQQSMDAGNVSNESADGNEVNPLDELVQTLLQDMTLEEKVAGMFMVSPESITGVTTAIQAGEGTKKAITENPVGGIIYSEKNFKSDEQFLEMLTNTKTFSKYPLFMAVSKECGEDTKFGVSITKKASELSDTDSVKQTYAMISEKLASYGVNMNFAPVAEVSADDGDAKLQGRVFGSDAATSAPLVNAAVQAMQEKEVSAVLKKFPGTGTNAKSLEELKNSEFLIYEMAIQNGADCIMVSHIAANGVTGDDTPSSLSSAIITDVLRNTLGFKGIVITDSLNDSAITGKYSDAEAAVAAIKAGADIILEPSDYKAAYEGVLKAVSEGAISKERIDESLYRIYSVKYKNSLN